jgi:hypothetical protein
MAELVVTLTGDEANLFRAQQKILKQEMEMAEGYVKAGKAGKKSADDIADAHVKAFAKSQEAARKLDQSYRDQVKSLELQNVAMTKGKAAAIEMKAIHEGLTKDQAKRLGDLQRQVDLTEKNKAALDGQTTSTDKIVGSVQAWATGVLSVGAGLKVADELITAYIVKQEKAYELAKKLAGGQQDAAINLAQIESPELKQIFSQKLPELQQTTGFADQSALLSGLGGAYSQAGDVETSLKAVEAAAKMTRQTPAALPTIAAGLAGLGTATGTTDAEANAALLLSTGKASAVTTQAGIAKNLAPVISASTMTVPTQDTQAASKEIAALFAVVSNQQKDFTGDTTKTQTSKFIREMGVFFDTLGEKTSEINSKINELETKDIVTPLEKAKLDKADFDVAEKTEAANRLRGRGGPDEAESVIALAEATASRDEMRTNSTLSADERKQLSELKSTQAALAPIRDPGTIGGRLSLLQGNDAAKEIVTKSLGSDEATGSYKALLDGSSDLANKYKQAASEITFSPQLFRDNAKKLEELTPELRVGTSASKVNAAAEVATMKDTSGATRAAILDLEKTAMSQTSVGGMTGVTNAFRYGSPLSFVGINASTRGTASALETDTMLAQESTKALSTRRESILANQRPGESRDANIQLIDTAIAEIKKLSESNAQTVALEKQNALVSEQNRILQQVANNTAPGQAPNPANAIRNQAANPPVLGAN